MKITIEKVSDTFVADRPNVPGSPLIGRGKTPMEALGSLLYCIQGELKIEVDVSTLESSAWKGSQFEGNKR